MDNEITKDQIRDWLKPSETDSLDELIEKRATAMVITGLHAEALALIDLEARKSKTQVRRSLATLDEIIAEVEVDRRALELSETYLPGWYRSARLCREATCLRGDDLRAWKWGAA